MYGLPNAELVCIGTGCPCLPDKENQTNYIDKLQYHVTRITVYNK